MASERRKTLQATAELLRRLPDLEALAQRLEDDPQELVARAFPAEDLGLLQRPWTTIPGALEMASPLDLTEVEPAVPIARELWLEAATWRVTMPLLTKAKVNFV
jgi:hypothetical protein